MAEHVDLHPAAVYTRGPLDDALNEWREKQRQWWYHPYLAEELKYKLLIAARAHARASGLPLTGLLQFIEQIPTSYGPEFSRLSTERARWIP